MLRRPGAVWLPWLAAGVVAVTFAPLRDTLQRGANRLTYGQWSQPAEVLAATARRLGDAADVPSLLRSLVDDVGRALDLPYMEITDPGGRSLVRRGEPDGEVDGLAMTSYGLEVGTLAWARRPLRDAHRSLLVDLSRQLGTLVHAVGLLDAVRVSQERLVLAREEERRRLRRDLHDGLGPALAGLMLRVDTLRNLLRTRLDADAWALADDGLLAVRAGIQGTVADVRRIVEGLRPPALDELGLAEAVAQLADRLTAGGGLTTEVRADALPRLEAAVEVAAYRIAQEALANVAEHAPGASVRVELEVGTGAHLRVRNGAARPGAPAVRSEGGSGLGLAGMRERAGLLGGTLTAGPEGDGWLVDCSLPLPAGNGVAAEPAR
jgi:signal transduction histidine kinase